MSIHLEEVNASPGGEKLLNEMLAASFVSISSPKIASPSRPSHPRTASRASPRFSPARGNAKESIERVARAKQAPPKAPRETPIRMRSTSTRARRISHAHDSERHPSRPKTSKDRRAKKKGPQNRLARAVTGFRVRGGYAREPPIPVPFPPPRGKRDMALLQLKRLSAAHACSLLASPPPSACPLRTVVDVPRLCR